MTSRKKSVLALKYAIRYIENLCLLPIIFFYKSFGRLVILDRHPLLESAQLPAGFFSTISTFLYKYLFYTPKNIFILYEEAEVINKRKNEKTVPEIEKYQENQKQYISAHTIDVHYVQNKDINETCSLIFKTIE